MYVTYYHSYVYLIQGYRVGYDMPERRNFRQYVQTVPTVQRRLAYSFNSHIQLLIPSLP